MSVLKTKSVTNNSRLTKKLNGGIFVEKGQQIEIDNVSNEENFRNFLSSLETGCYAHAKHTGEERCG